MNVRLLRKIAKVIQENPRQFDMKHWHWNSVIKRKSSEAGRWTTFESLCDLPKEKQIACGTTHCIAGWAQALSSKRECKTEANIDARRLLELTIEKSNRLFYCDQWPEQFQGKNDLWKPSAKNAVARIEHFIKTDGAE